MVSILVIAGLCAFVWVHRDDMRLFYNLRFPFLVAIAFGQAATVLFNGFFLKVMLDGLGTSVCPSEYVSLSAIGSLSNLVFPFGGGLGVKVVYLRVLHGLDAARFAIRSTGLYSVVFCANSLAGLLLMADRRHTPFGMTVCLFLAAVALLTTASITTPVWRFCRERFKLLGPSVGRIFEELHEIGRLRGDLIRLFAVLFGNIIVFGYVTYIEFAALGSGAGADFSVSFRDSVLLSVIGSFSLLVSVTPAGLGVRESISILVGRCMGISEAQVLAVCLLDRAVNLVVLAVMGGASYFVLQNRLKVGRAACGPVEKD